MRVSNEKRRQSAKGKNERGDLELSGYRRERAAEKALEAERELAVSQQALAEVKIQAAEEIGNLDRQITEKKIDLAVQNAMESYKNSFLKELDMKLAETNRKVEIAEHLYREMATQSGDVNLFDKVVDLKYENEQLESKVQLLQEKLEQAFEFMILDDELLGRSVTLIPKEESNKNYAENVKLVYK